MKMMGERGGALWRGLIASGLALTVLAGCDKQPPPAREDDGFANEVTEAPPVPVEPPPVVEQAPPPKLPEPDTNVADALPAEDPPSPDAQMLEDADATGLTSRTAPTSGAEDNPSDAAPPSGDSGG